LETSNYNNEEETILKSRQHSIEGMKKSAK